MFYNSLEETIDLADGITEIISYERIDCSITVAEEITEVCNDSFLRFLRLLV